MIALDAMGGDYAPQEIVLGAYRAAQYKNIGTVLVGDEHRVSLLLDTHDTRWRDLPLKVAHAPLTAGMGTLPSRRELLDQDNSLARALRMVHAGEAEAVISAGNSAAVLYVSTLLSKRLAGVSRPAFATFVPTDTGMVLCLDVGASADSKPEHLLQFAYLGYWFCQSYYGYEHALKIGLLSNGEESYKGTAAGKVAYDLLQRASLPFVGNCEPKDILAGAVDIVVCDGFHGNIFIKTMQATAKTVGSWLRHEGRRSVINRVSLLASAPLLLSLHNKVAFHRALGAYVLGVEDPVIVAHGNSDARVIEQMLCSVRKQLDNKIFSTFHDTYYTQHGAAQHPVFGVQDER